MRIVTDITDLPPFHGCVFVPTMGALHEGHLSLIRLAKEHGKPVLVSIFVNPEQFAPDEDFERYPRNLSQDVTFAADAGADVVFAPEVGGIYPDTARDQTSFTETATTDLGTVSMDVALPPAATEPRLEDSCRPTHFRGVCMVVARLFDLVRPTIAVFGEKDYQQFTVIRQLVEQEHPRWEGLRIIGAPIIRDDDGLAMSSRNVYLTPEQRTRALGLHKAIACHDEAEMIRVLQSHDLNIEYAVIRDEASLLDPVAGRPTRALVAAKVGTVRLIDNARVKHS